MKWLIVINKIYNFFKNIFIILLITLLTDIVVFFFTSSEIKASLFVNRAHRIKSFYYHHDLRNKAYFYDIWGYERYKIFTNNLGFKDKSNRNVEFKKNNILFIGDSFTEGVGLPFEDTYVGIIASKLKNVDTEVLNAGVQSYSPKIYYAKLYDIIYRKKYPISHVVVMISGGDVYDDYYKYGEVNSENLLLHQDFQNKYVINLINFIKGNTLTYQLITRITPPKVIPELIKSFFQEKDEIKNYSTKENELKRIKDDEIMSFELLKRSDYEYFYDDEKFLEWGKDAIDESSLYIKKIDSILKEKNIKLDILYSQSAPLVLIEPIEKNLNYLINSFEKSLNNSSAKFHYIRDFTTIYSSRIEAYKELFYIGDVHLNKKGNTEIAKEIINKLNF